MAWPGPGQAGQSELFSQFLPITRPGGNRASPRHDPGWAACQRCPTGHRPQRPGPGHPGLIGKLASADNRVRNLAEQQIQHLPADVQLRLLLAALEHDSAQARESAVRLLGQARDKSAAGPVAARLLMDEDVTVRRQAAQALGSLGNLSARKPLRQALDDEDRFVRMAALNSLLRLDPKGNIELLQDRAG